MAITLNKLGDFENACAAYEKAIEMEKQILHLFHLILLLGIIPFI
jgi:hypothetical protein